VLLLGETGTGKEVLARAIHAESGRDGPFVAVNCGALPKALVESLLFGHRRGAFSGATEDQIGFVRAAHGGTLFLDEIGDLAASSQAALLRILQEREVVPVGATRPVSTDIRVIAATHRPLDQLIEGGQFRSDLFARIAGFSFTLPPLRDRLDDIGLLVAALLPRIAADRAPALTFTARAVHALMASRWPYNVRELEQRLKVAVLASNDGRIDTLRTAEGESAGGARNGDRKLSSHEQALCAELVAKLALHHGNVTRVAEAMGYARSQVQRWLRRFQIDARKFRT
jgi:transcriptional regulator with PAS, ATPase and Fis domain